MIGMEDEAKLPYTQAVLKEVFRASSIAYAGVPHYTKQKVNKRF